MHADGASQQVSQRTMRRLFRFDIYGQRLIGLGPALTQRSDHLCILQGARVPFIVRENAELGKYTLVGEAFAESFMHGEVEHLKFDGSSLCDVTLVDFRQMSQKRRGCSTSTDSPSNPTDDLQGEPYAYDV